jgi:uncharacterized membrane protein HdeD (DUF308 family)
LVSIIIGLVAFFLPAATIFTVTLMFGAFVLVDGIVSLTAAVRSARRGEHWWELLFIGVCGLLAGTAIFLWTGLTLLVLIYIVAIWSVTRGVFEVATAIRIRRYIEGEWLMILAGIVSILFGLLLFAAPGPAAIVLAWWIGAYFLIAGILMVALAVRLRRGSHPLNLRHA